MAKRKHSLVHVRNQAKKHKARARDILLFTQTWLYEQVYNRFWHSYADDVIPWEDPRSISKASKAVNHTSVNYRGNVPRLYSGGTIQEVNNALDAVEQTNHKIKGIGKRQENPWSWD